MKINGSFIEMEVLIGEKPFSVLINEEDESKMIELLKRLDQAGPTKKQQRPTGFERVHIGSKYYIANDSYAYTESGSDFDDENYDAANYYCYSTIADVMSRVINLFSRMVRFALENGGLCSDPWNGYEIDYVNGHLTVRGPTICHAACSPIFATKEDAQAAMELFREDLLWYFTVFAKTWEDDD